jgi:transcriptional regulator with XRE-family HTH domain
MNRVTEALIEARRQAGLTQQQLAELLGITQPTLADIERGRRRLSTKHYRQLPDAIRGQVIDAAIRELRGRIEELEAVRGPDTGFAEEYARQLQLVASSYTEEDRRWLDDNLDEMLDLRDAEEQKCR